MTMEMVLVIGGMMVLAVAGQLWAMKRRERLLVPADDVVGGEQAGPGWTLTWGEAQEVVEQRAYQGNQYRTWSELTTMQFVEVRATELGPALRVANLPEPLRTLARALDGNDIFIGDHHVRIAWKDGSRSGDHERDRARLLFVVLRYSGAKLIKQIEGLAASGGRVWVLGKVLGALEGLAGIEALAHHVRPTDAAELRLVAAILLRQGDTALELALHEDVPTDLRLRAVDRFGEQQPVRADVVLQRLLTREDALRSVGARIRALPRERALALLVPLVTELPALTLLAAIDPGGALPHLRAAAQQKFNHIKKLAAARLLHAAEPTVAEDALIELVEADSSELADVVAELGRLGSERCVQPLLALINEGHSEEVRDVAIASLAEVRARLANRPAGALALSEQSEGGLALAREAGGLTEDVE